MPDQLKAERTPTQVALQRPTPTLRPHVFEDEIGPSRVLPDDGWRCRKIGGSGHVTPNGYYSVERTLKVLASKGGKIGICGSCMDAHGLKAETLAERAHPWHYG